MNLKEKIRTVVSKIEMLTPEEIETIVEITIVDSFKKGTVLLKEGQIPTKCYMVLEGCLREYQIIDGEEKPMSLFKMIKVSEAKTQSEQLSTLPLKVTFDLISFELTHIF